MTLVAGSSAVPSIAANMPPSRLCVPDALFRLAPARTAISCCPFCRRPASQTRLPVSWAFALGADKSTTGDDERGDDRVERQVQRAVVLLAAVLAEVDHGAVAAAVGVLDDDVAQQHRVAVGPRGVGGVDQVELAVGRVVDVAVLDAVVVGAALDVVAGQAGVDFAARSVTLVPPRYRLWL